MLKKLRNPESDRHCTDRKGIKGRSQAVSAEGGELACFLHSLRLGICLADDMGLGKTVQVIGLLTIIKYQETWSAESARGACVPAFELGE